MTPDPTTTDIPQEVIDALLYIRESAITNMLNHATVLWLCEDMGFDDAADWLKTNSQRYMDALNAMGAQVRR